MSSPRSSPADTRSSAQAVPPPDRSQFTAPPHRPSATAPITSNANTPQTSASLPAHPDGRSSGAWVGVLRSEGPHRSGATASVLAPGGGASFAVASAPFSSDEDPQGGTEIFDPHALVAADHDPSEGDEAPPYQPPSHLSFLPPAASSSAPNVSSASLDTGPPAAEVRAAAVAGGPGEPAGAGGAGAPALAAAGGSVGAASSAEDGPSAGPPSTAPALPGGSSGVRGASFPGESDGDSQAAPPPPAAAAESDASDSDPERDRSEDVWAARNLTPSHELPPRRVRPPPPLAVTMSVPRSCPHAGAWHRCRTSHPQHASIEYI